MSSLLKAISLCDRSGKSCRRNGLHGGKGLYCQAYHTVREDPGGSGAQGITTGPYRFFRHPMYVGATVITLSLPVALGSLFDLIPAALLVVYFVVRRALQDKTLHNELEGYKEYAQRTKYRLVPGIW